MKNLMRIFIAALMALPTYSSAAGRGTERAEQEPDWLLQVDSTTDLFVSDFQRGFPADRIDVDTLKTLVDEDLQALKSTKEVLNTLSATSVQELEAVIDPLSATDKNIALAPFEVRASRWVQDIMRAHNPNEVDAVQIYLFTRMLAEPENRRALWTLLQAFRDEKLDDYYRTRMDANEDYRFNIARGVGYSLVAWWVFALLPTRFKSKRTYGQLIDKTAKMLPRLWERGRVRRLSPVLSRFRLEDKATASMVQKTVVTRNAPSNYPAAQPQPYNPRQLPVVQRPGRNLPSTEVIINGQVTRPAAVTQRSTDRVRPPKTWWQKTKDRFWGLFGYAPENEVAEAAVRAAPTSGNRSGQTYNPRQLPSTRVYDQRTGTWSTTSPRVVAEPIPVLRVRPQPVANALTNMKTNFIMEFLRKPRKQQMRVIAKFLALHTAGATAYGVSVTQARRAGWWMFDDYSVLPQEEMDQYVADALVLQFQCRVQSLANTVKTRRYSDTEASRAQYKSDAQDLYSFYEEYAFLKVVAPTKYSKHVVPLEANFKNGKGSIRFDEKTKKLSLVRDYENQTVTESWDCPQFRPVGRNQAEVSLAEGLIDLELIKHRIFKARIEQKVGKLEQFARTQGSTSSPSPAVVEAAQTIATEAMDLSTNALQEFVDGLVMQQTRGHLTAPVILKTLKTQIEESDRFGTIDWRNI